MADLEVIVPTDELLAEGEVLSKLRAEEFIKPQLEEFGKAVVVDASIYPTLGAGPVGGRRGVDWLMSLFGHGKTSARRSKYQRTGEFGRSWRHSLTGLDEKVENLASYAGWVMGDKQPYTWRTGWRRLRLIMEDTMDIWILKMEQKAFQLWRRG